MTPARGLVALVLAAGLASACSSVLSGTGTLSGRAPTPSHAQGAVASPSPVPTTPPELPPPTWLDHLLAMTWMSRWDSAAHVRFALPGHPALQTRNTYGFPERSYEVSQTDTNNTVGVGIVELPSPAAAVAALSAYPAAIKREFDTIGPPPGFAITEQHASDYRGRRAYDLRISFTPTRLPGETTVWFVRLLQARNDLVILQTIAGAPKSNLAVYVTRCRAIQQRLIDAIRFS